MTHKKTPLASIKTTIARAWNLVYHQEYVPTEYFIFDELRLVYVSIPKVACTSIKIALMASELGETDDPGQYMNVHSATARYQRHNIARHQRNYYKFAYVRNPFDRLVSCYKDKVRKPVQHNGRYHFATNYNKVLVRCLAGETFRPDMSFEEFVNVVARIPDFLSDSHFRSQYSMLYRQGKCTVDHIGKFESLNKDWEQLATRFKLPALGDKNRTESDDWKRYYDNKSVLDAVYRRFQRDIDTFGYTHDYRELQRRLPKTR